MNIVYDRYGNLIRSFKTYDEAYKFKIVNQRFDWIIK